ncbi:CcdB family protein [Hydrogenophaga sp. PBL-H3]|uniref:CcdB family protein n=1 Tax=Hydrogenophaga sp. PBL-H3 TaxID=434010 RepID=UPI001F1AA28C|nr:CcdB family protein [Hydrogenophaga sp. PBL-H3]
MPQYDVYANPSRSAAEGIPYVVVIQSDLLDALATRLTMPLPCPPKICADLWTTWPRRPAPWCRP